MFFLARAMWSPRGEAGLPLAGDSAKGALPQTGSPGTTPGSPAAQRAKSLVGRISTTRGPTSRPSVRAAPFAHAAPRAGPGWQRAGRRSRAGAPGPAVVGVARAAEVSGSRVRTRRRHEGPAPGQAEPLAPPSTPSPWWLRYKVPLSHLALFLPLNWGPHSALSPESRRGKAWSWARRGGTGGDKVGQGPYPGCAE